MMLRIFFLSPHFFVESKFKENDIQNDQLINKKKPLNLMIQGLLYFNESFSLFQFNGIGISLKLELTWYFLDFFILELILG
jgi:hypothetical protein